jgi:fatty acid desaturase
MRIDEARLRHPMERPLFFAYVVLNFVLMFAALFIVFQGSEWLKGHPRLAKYHGRIRVLAIAAALGLPAASFVHNTRHALTIGNSIEVTPDQLPQLPP